jgi:hypothetical protein
MPPEESFDENITAIGRNFDLTVRQVQDLRQENAELREKAATIDQCQRNLQELLKNVGDAGSCEGCRAVVFWVTHKKGNELVPYNADGTGHSENCSGKELQIKRRKN